MTAEVASIGEDISLFLGRPDALDSLNALLREATCNRALLQRLSQNLLKTYQHAPEVLPIFLGLLESSPERDASFVAVYRELLLNLAAVQPTSISLILHTLVSGLARRDVLPFKTLGELQIDALVNRRSLDLICGLMKRLPAASRLLATAIERHFPYYMRSLSELVSYVANILELASRMPAWRLKIIELLICKALVVDVELQNYEDVDIEERNSLISTNIDMENEEVNRREERKIKAAEFRQKLDFIMTIVMEHVLGLTGADQRAMDQLLLEVFEKSILATFKARHLHFLLFHLIIRRPSLADDFLGLLFRPLVLFCEGLDHGRTAANTPPPSLLSALAFIGSFVARCPVLSEQLLQLAFQILCNLCLRLLSKASTLSMGILPVLSLQHLMYIFTARRDQIMTIFGEEELIDLFDTLFLSPESDVHEEITGPDALIMMTKTALVPSAVRDDVLKVLAHCHRATVEAFLLVADHQKNLVDPEVAIAYVEALNRGQSHCQHQSQYEDFENYFPFDPIHLPFFNQRYAIPVERKDGDTGKYCGDDRISNGDTGSVDSSSNSSSSSNSRPSL